MQTTGGKEGEGETSKRSIDSIRTVAIVGGSIDILPVALFPKYGTSPYGLFS